MHLLLLDVVYVKSIVLAIIGIIVVVVGTVPVITCIPISIIIIAINLFWPILCIS